jgi:hypothetical protein
MLPARSLAHVGYQTNARGRYPRGIMTQLSLEHDLCANAFRACRMETRFHFSRSALAEHVLIDHVLADGFAVEHAQNIACGLLAHPIDRFACNAGHVRRYNDIGKLEQ